MPTTATRLKNLAFLAVSVLGRIAVQHADLGHYVGLRDHYTVTVRLDRTGGLFEHAEVTYRGVPVGRVGALRLTADGVEADLRIDDSAPRIPARLTAVVADLSAVGEQYLDLRPTTDTGPWLSDGSVVARADTSTPAPVTDVLGRVDGLVSSVPLQSLRTVVDELGAALDGQGGNLQALLDSGSRFVSAARTALPATERLVVDAQTVLGTQADETAAIRDFATGADRLARQLRDSDADLRTVLATAPQTAVQVTRLTDDLDPGLSVVLANLLTTAELGVTRQHGIEELLVRLPAVAAAGSTAVDADGAHLGVAVTFFSPLPCTDGYRATPRRNGLDTGPAPQFNTAAHCAAPAGSGTAVRTDGITEPLTGHEVPPSPPCSSPARGRPTVSTTRHLINRRRRLATARPATARPAPVPAGPQRGGTTATLPEPAGPATAPERRARRLRGIRPWAVLLAAAAVCAGLAGAAGLRAADLRADGRAHNTALTDAARTSEVRGAVTDAVNRLFSYSFADPARTDAAAKTLLTGKAVEQYGTLLGQVRAQAARRKLVLTTTVTDSGVERLDGDRARLLLHADQSNTSTAEGSPTGASYAAAMFAVEAVRRDGRWQIESIDTFGR
ncbi:MlaD family protein [Streptomyces sp. NRRL B-24484]|uniref:MCE family protein n=1 Tax=Streptomyces sp. NRRL B-24484 TaxID=1463833 RepID=UPI000694A6C8